MKSSLWTIGLLSLLLFSGCSAALAPQNAKPGDVLFSDDLAGSSAGWGLWNDNQAVVQFDEKGKGLRIAVKEKQYDFWSLAGKDFADAQIEVDAVRLGGTEDNDFGVICRYVDKNNFYSFLISSDGYYGIAKVKDSQYSLVGAGQLQHSGAIAGGEALNHLRADCAGDRLRLYVNGQLLHEAQDADFKSGDVGLLAGTYEEGNVDILFRNFKVKKPE